MWRVIHTPGCAVGGYVGDLTTPTSALWHMVITRMVPDPQTRHYIERRMKEGHTKKEAISCLKRYIAREVYKHLPIENLALDSP